MFLTLISIIKSMIFFTGSYGNNVFPPPLSNDDEEMYVTKMLNGDKDARAKLIEHNLRLVAHIVKKFDNKTTDTDDLISIGTIGLIKGIDTYKKTPKVKITTYAARCIQNEILMYYRSNKKNGLTVSLNDSIGYDKEGNEIITKRFGLNNQKDLTQKEIAENLGISRSYVSRIEKRALTKILREFMKSKSIN